MNEEEDKEWEQLANETAECINELLRDGREQPITEVAAIGAQVQAALRDRGVEITSSHIAYVMVGMLVCGMPTHEEIFERLKVLGAFMRLFGDLAEQGKIPPYGRPIPSTMSG